MNKILKEWGYTVDVETTINALRGNCVPDTQRYFSRLDFTVLNCVGAILLLEVDECQHDGYDYILSCELSRMADVRAALITAGHTAPIYWIRYNPNGKYLIGSEAQKVRRTARELELKKHLKKLCSVDFVPDNEVTIHYMFYNLQSAELGPEILLDPDFPHALKEVVTWCV